MTKPLKIGDQVRAAKTGPILTVYDLDEVKCIASVNYIDNNFNNLMIKLQIKFDQLKLEPRAPQNNG